VFYKYSAIHYQAQAAAHHDRMCVYFIEARDAMPDYRKYCLRCATAYQELSAVNSEMARRCLITTLNFEVTHV